MGRDQMTDWKRVMEDEAGMHAFQCAFKAGWQAAIEKDPRVKAAFRLIDLQEKLLICYLVGKQPGKWLDEIGRLNEALSAFRGKEE